ncbi:MAG: Hsp20/alpha crystallin family protein [Chloroflexi bacterium]|nr:Hsp20/alpha crystallin family protein [Chloroflexota bacterium]MBU1660395.1 Hsp20/alpha crystallin family protein [Chloroflexota bacterium]
MTNDKKELEVQKQEMTPSDETERTRECRCFVPRSDIYETDDNVVVVVDMPGVDEDNIDITLEKNIVTINGYANLETPDGYSLVFAEYEVGDYERSFRLSSQIDSDGIEATYKNGTLRLNLPKAAVAKTRKISVKAG